MATKYYGIILVRIFLLAEGARLLSAESTLSEKSTLGEWCSCSAVIVISFTAAFFVASPYNFPDPTWFGFMTGGLQPFLTGATEVRYEPDRQIAFEIDYVTIPRAIANTVIVLARPQILGPLLSGLILLGIVSNLWKQDTRRTSGLILGSVGVFLRWCCHVGALSHQPAAFYPDSAAVGVLHVCWGHHAPERAETSSRPPQLHDRRIDARRDHAERRP